MIRLEILDNEDFNTEYSLCKQCGGKCCKKNACDCSPDDFDNNIEKMRQALKSGNYTIDFSREDASSFIFENNEIILETERVRKNPMEFFYIRPKNINRPIVDFIHTEDIEGPCIFWNKDNGCPFEYKKRPKGGRTMVPFSEGNCIMQYNKVFMIREWKPYEEELIQMVKEFYDSNWKIYKELNFKIR